MSTSVSRRSSATGHPTRQQLDELDALLQRMLDLPVNRLEEDTAAAAGEPEAPDAAREKAGAPRPAPHAEPPAVNYSTAEEEEADLKPRVVPDERPPAKASAAAPAEQPAAGRPEDWVPLTSTWRPSPRTWKPLSEAWKQAREAAGRPAEPPAVEEAPALASEAPPAAAEAPAPPPEPRAEADPQTPAPAAESAPTPPAESPRIAPAEPAAAAAPRWLLWPLLGLNAAFDGCLVPFGPAGRWLRGRAGRMALGVAGLLALAAAAALAAADWFGWTG